MASSYLTLNYMLRLSNQVSQVLIHGSRFLLAFADSTMVMT